MLTGNGNVATRTQTLLQKYDMPVECLSFEHIEKCSNVKELENILKILRSGEEGRYAQLENVAEEKLRTISPNNPLLRIETPVIPTSSLNPSERELVSNDMQKWSEEMSSLDNVLKAEESVEVDGVPAIRNSTILRAVNEKNKMNKSTSPKPKEKQTKKCVPNNYTFWDKFDADNEVLKMELEEERIAERKEIEKKQQEESQKMKMKLALEEETAINKRLKDLNSNSGSGDGLSLPAREFNSLQEKMKGNEYFRIRDLQKALHHYNCSISFLPNVDAFNNRAQTYLKLENFAAAIEDCQTVLNMDPNNVKAYYRRGSALFSLEKFQDALDDFDKALEINPNDKDIQDFAKRTRLKMGIPVSSKRVRVPIQTKASSVAVEEVHGSDAHDKYYPFFNTSPNEDFALNAIGTAKVMCRCNGTPVFMKKVRSLEDIKDHGRLCLRRNSRSQKKDAINAVQSVTADEKSSDANMHSVTLKCEDESSKNMNTDEQLLQSHLATQKHVSTRTVHNSDELSNLEKQKTPFSFSVFYSSIKNRNDLPTVAKALRVLCPEEISQVIGNKLEEKMLSLFILALRSHFSLPDEWGVVQQYLQSFTKLPRFSFVNMMLDKGTKRELEMMLNDAETLGLRVHDLLQLYGLTACP